MRELHRHLERIDSLVFLILYLYLLHCFLSLLCTLRFSRSALATAIFLVLLSFRLACESLLLCSHDLHEYS